MYLRESVYVNEYEKCDTDCIKEEAEGRDVKGTFRVWVVRVSESRVRSG